MKSWFSACTLSLAHQVTTRTYVVISMIRKILTSTFHNLYNNQYLFPKSKSNKTNKTGFADKLSHF